MNLKIKICGMTDAANMREIAGLKPDLFGLIFYEKSPRYVSLERAKALPQFASVKRVGVFVNETFDNILKTTEAANLSFIQLHGDESPEFCREIKRQNLNVIKVFQVDEDFNDVALKDYETICDYFLFDTKTSKHGGSGKSFDWTILQRCSINKPFFLSGGIGVENAAEAIAACANLPLYALDINSCAEISAGIKSFKIVEKIIKSL